MVRRTESNSTPHSPATQTVTSTSHAYKNTSESAAQANLKVHAWINLTRGSTVPQVATTSQQITLSSNLRTNKNGSAQATSNFHAGPGSLKRSTSTAISSTSNIATSTSDTTSSNGSSQPPPRPLPRPPAVVQDQPLYQVTTLGATQDFCGWYMSPTLWCRFT